MGRTRFNQEAKGRYECDDCHLYYTIEALGYYGPKNRKDTKCNPFMTWETVCETCENKRKANARPDYLSTQKKPAMEMEA